jgi:hypothetical protein
MPCYTAAVMMQPRMGPLLELCLDRPPPPLDEGLQGGAVGV